MSDRIPIKMLLDLDKKPFLPYTTAKAVMMDGENKSVQDIIKQLEQGSSGPGGSGVHIGNEAPTDDSNVWIDLDEEPEEYATKQYVDEMLGVIENGSY